MTTISKETFFGVNEKKRKENLAKIGYDLRKSKKNGELHLVKKVKPKK